MSTDLTTLRSRRALLTAAAGGAAAATAAVMAQAVPAAATNGDAVTVGGVFTGTSATELKNTTNAADVLKATSTGSGIALRATSAAESGVWGKTSGSGKQGVYGLADTATSHGVKGFNSVHAANGFLGGAGSGNAGAGVHGRGGQHGVLGENDTKYAVEGVTKTGVGLSGIAQENDGLALLTQGNVKFYKASGVAKILPGTRAITVNPGLDISSQSFVLLTARGRLGGRDLWYSLNKAANTITIRVSSAVPKKLAIGWFLLS